MSQQSKGDKTEKATPQKLRKAKKEGQVARSRDIGTAVGVLVALKLIVVLAPGWLIDLRRLFALSFADLSADGALGDTASMLFPATLLLIGKMLAPLVAVPAAVIIASIVPGGWVMSSKNFMPKMSRMNPIEGIKRLVSGKHYIQFGTTMVKAMALIATLVIVCRVNLVGFAKLQGAPLANALAGGADLFLNSALAMAGMLVLFALIDVPVQWMIFMRGQRMSKRDIKDEMKQSEGKPEVKSRIRQIQRQLARQGIRKTVPTADVVVMNPTHYAVALKYDESRAHAPYVVAKGIDETALFIRDVAKEHGIEVIELPPLARAVYHTSQVNQQIPAALYRAVAQVLTYVLQIKAFRHGKRGLEPMLPNHFDIPDHLQKAQS
ncbi:flagellar type III secretion system protein FlhB [Ralstonia flaminis]|jgi:flagellar biosynthetic protein FlhB|uniref:Flagellar biosynthetic protein FlhB n=1 Tax=Ralstonia flaminis TaxID=3058597 RepID=A0ABN9JT57_9RALS|nr:flagellar type III secretion system protein FlhB [Ralstonia sp. LMG 18101]CAJ0819365.1 Flagellar biosynthetic protein FlhB [Ralstonia sp. LMG 18101]